MNMQTTPSFQTVRNFRDCGGYPTQDGRAMRKGRLYRSAQFHDAADDDLESLKALGITAIVDLRRPVERERYPSRRWADFDAHVVELRASMAWHCRRISPPLRMPARVAQRRTKQWLRFIAAFPATA